MRPAPAPALPCRTVLNFVCLDAVVLTHPTAHPRRLWIRISTCSGCWATDTTHRTREARRESSWSIETCRGAPGAHVFPRPPSALAQQSHDERLDVAHTTIGRDSGQLATAASLGQRHGRGHGHGADADTTGTNLYRQRVLRV